MAQLSDSPSPLAAEVGTIREASRQIVRELGMLEHTCAPAGVTHTQCHALIELERAGAATAGELAECLRVDKSSMSRAVSDLVRRRMVIARPDPDDARRRRLALAAAGRRVLERLHAGANARVQAALELLAPEDRARVQRAMSKYARALARARALSAHVIRPIEPRDDALVAKIIREVLAEHGAVGPGYAGADAEVSSMSSAYRDGLDPPARYYVVERDGGDSRSGVIVGGGGFGPLTGGSAGTCELRKMYLLPSARGTGVGRHLLDRCLRDAGAAGYERCYLETPDTMGRARALYESAGFERLERPEGTTGHHACDTFYARSLSVLSGIDTSDSEVRTRGPAQPATGALRG
jgi:putative acetyltransferase